MKLSNSCYAITGLACIPPWTVNSGFIVGASRTLIIDTGINLLAAQTIYGYATAVQPSNSLVVINTERHLDHVTGNVFFQERGIDIYGHAGIVRHSEELLSEIEDYNACITDPVRRKNREASVIFADTRLANPNRPISRDTTLELDDLSVEIIMTPGHTPTNLSIYLPREGVVYCGDCLVTGYQPNLMSGNLPDWQTWLQSLGRLEALQPRTIVPGHGQVLTGSAITAEIDRIRSVLQQSIQTAQKWNTKDLS